MHEKPVICGQTSLVGQLKELNTQNGSWRKCRGPKIASESMVKLPVCE